jgi:hypothetical protein
MRLVGPCLVGEPCRELLSTASSSARLSCAVALQRRRRLMCGASHALGQAPALILFFRSFRCAQRQFCLLVLFDLRAERGAGQSSVGLLVEAILCSGRGVKARWPYLDVLHDVLHVLGGLRDDQQSEASDRRRVSRSSWESSLGRRLGKRLVVVVAHVQAACCPSRHDKYLSPARVSRILDRLLGRSVALQERSPRLLCVLAFAQASEPGLVHVHEDFCDGIVEEVGHVVVAIQREHRQR